MRLTCERCGKEFEAWNSTEYMNICIDCFIAEQYRRFSTDLPREKVYPVADAFEIFKQYGEGYAYIYGATGTGKTVLALQILQAYREIEFRRIVEENRAVSDPSLIMQYGSFFSCPLIELRIKSDPSEAFNLIEYINEDSHLVILDDFGRGIRQKSDFVNDFWFNVLNIREMRGLRTVITSEKSLDELREILGEAIPSRIYAVTKGNIFRKTGEDKRLEVLDEKEP